MFSVVPQKAHALALPLEPMAKEPMPKSQKTTPKGKDKSGKPHKSVQVPALKRKDFDAAIRRAAEPEK
jgi:hypothetical protein